MEDRSTDIRRAGRTRGRVSHCLFLWVVARIIAELVEV
jgi:hypothetical protein